MRAGKSITVSLADRRRLENLIDDRPEECATGGSRVKNLAEKVAAKKRGEYAAHLSALEESGESQVSLTENCLLRRSFASPAARSA
jgi:hypothetical protein